MEMMQLIDAVKGYPFYIVTERNAMSRGVVAPFRHHFLLQQERSSWCFLFRFAFNIAASYVYLMKEKPDIIITTGAGAAYPTCRIGKKLGAKVIYIESFAKYNEPSLTGNMVYPFADEFYVQWPEMLCVYPDARYNGTVY